MSISVYDVDCSTQVAVYEPNGMLRGPIVGDGTPCISTAGSRDSASRTYVITMSRLGHVGRECRTKRFLPSADNRATTPHRRRRTGQTAIDPRVARLEAGWFKSMYDLTISVTEPGPDYSFYYGRPNGIVRDMSQFQNDLCNLIRVRITLRCPNPQRYQGS